jgi:hypothetical protein
MHWAARKKPDSSDGRGMGLEKLYFEFFRAARTYAMGEGGVGMLADILFDGLPVAVVRADAFAPAANWNHARQDFYLVQEPSQFADQFLAFYFGALAAGPFAADPLS